MKRIALYLTTALAPFQLYAEAPNVVTDILPVHSLVSRVMDGVGTPELLVPSNASPHGFSLRVSQASALENADLVVWVGKDLTMWLDSSLKSLAEDAQILTLMDAPGMTLLDFRGDHDHDHDHGEGHDDHDEHADHDDHDGHDHGDHENHAEDGHDDHDHEDDHKHDEANNHDHDDHDGHGDHDGHEGHAHEEGGHDPHMWLDPVNAAAIVTAVADALSEQDPDNADTYNANAKAATAEMYALTGEITATLAPVSERPFMVLHDAYQYFDARFGLTYEGSILDLSGASPGPKGLAEAKEHLEEHGVVCIFTEPQLSNKLVETVTADATVKQAMIDPLGADLEPGPSLYPDMMRALAAEIKTCLE